MAVTIQGMSMTGSFGINDNTPLSVDFLIIAGGGGGGWGGGGAGGYRTSVGTSGGGATAETPLTISPGVTYTVTVGAGGTGYTPRSGNGANSNIYGGTVSVISLGGGGGGDKAGSYTETGFVGGSGGGAGIRYDTAGYGANGTVGQGFAGGNVTLYYYGGAAAGGGGAGGRGQTVPGDNLAGAGGVGVYSTITGTSVGRGGGGSGFMATYNRTYPQTAPVATEGGGRAAYGLTGSAGTPSTWAIATPGTGQTGGGGAGGDNSGTTSYSPGGSGVVILRYDAATPVANTTGSPIITVSGRYRIYQFNSSGTITF